ncbi:MAG: hypothetical protein ACE5GO_04860 [Anaerolineales bacterium]
MEFFHSPLEYDLEPKPLPSPVLSTLNRALYILLTIIVILALILSLLLPLLTPRRPLPPRDPKNEIQASLTETF